MDMEREESDDYSEGFFIKFLWVNFLFGGYFFILFFFEYGKLYR